MLITKGESVQRNTSAEGVPVVRKQIQDLKDSWDSLLSSSIQCKRSDSFQKECLDLKAYVSTFRMLFKYECGSDGELCLRLCCLCISSQLEGALSHWTSYQDDVSQFGTWMERVEESLGNSDKHYAEMRDKTANLGRAKATKL